MARNQGILSVEGFTGVAGGLLFFAFWDRAVSIAIGDGSILSRKTADFCVIV